MTRYIATVEHDAGEYWIRFPGIEKAGSHAKRPEDIVPLARNLLTGRRNMAHRRPRSMTRSANRSRRSRAGGLSSSNGTRQQALGWTCADTIVRVVLGVPVPAEKLDLAFGRLRPLCSAAVRRQYYPDGRAFPPPGGTDGCRMPKASPPPTTAHPHQRLPRQAPRR